eukprot:TRINITY_DN608_c0_g1_i2.p1 TRINITY_DN608_c0_g1~~TRINITY_DN608_c0_g1_i2.p1  ORF type:complete len:280 (+),score=76.65 TRINITY_DN608_c0_g1_i2:32-841(+)
MQIDKLIGDTPLVEIDKVNNVSILAKIEKKNNGGSVKDRAALGMVRDAESKGLLTPGGTIIEATSGNTGISLAMLGAILGYKVILTMPSAVTVERRALLKSYGAELILVEGGMAGACAMAEKLEKEHPGCFYARQFENPANPAIHEKTTGPEIDKALEGKRLDYFVAGVGTGGTLSGTGRYLKSKRSGVKVIAVEPKKSPLLSSGVAAPHGIQGIGANFVPKNFDRSVCDQIELVTDEDAYKYAILLGKKGLHVGVWSTPIHRQSIWKH